eukprot:CAMPEP_0172446998 /NCGR_PEP_ID=MMETSP1065-20121228/6403_1 /TAXON_ID=265537 /ORGANISM="Amphiprora paludosa, Strain CCMP125" /LENGTH=415 /DNA_ID=CAMNT_0013198191 /DNA_START=6 /DNA_END=1256 /DNA_ORIENTATION=+
MSLSTSRKFDLIIYGATGFTGQLAAEYVQTHYPDLKYALAGRNKAKLEQVRKQIGASPENVPVLVADAVQDPSSLKELAASTKVIANYAGTPFIDKALPVVEACVEAGTCYTDITAELAFERTTYDRYHKTAEENKALIIHACGFDSVPSDVGAMMAAKAMKERHNCECSSIKTVVMESSGAMSGGTVATGMDIMFGPDRPGAKEVQARGKYALDPEGATGGPDTSDTVSFTCYDDVAKTQVIPFLMAPANAPVVRKTNALMGYLYGRNCSYSEVAAVPNRVVGIVAQVAFGVFGALLMFPPTRWLLLEYALPKPGQGPTKEQQEKGFFTNKVFAVGDTPEKPVTVAYIKSVNAGDPGYKATACMSIEASLCMAMERESLPMQGGVLTPASALGTTLVDRLNKSGMQLGVEPATS